MISECVERGSLNITAIPVTRGLGILVDGRTPQKRQSEKWEKKRKHWEKSLKLPLLCSWQSRKKMKVFFREGNPSHNLNFPKFCISQVSQNFWLRPFLDHAYNGFIIVIDYLSSLCVLMSYLYDSNTFYFTDYFHKTIDSILHNLVLNLAIIAWIIRNQFKSRLVSRFVLCKEKSINVDCLKRFHL